MSERSKANLINYLSWFVLTAIALTTIFAYTTSYYGWQIYLEVFSHFQVQYFVFSLVLFGLLAALGRRPQIYLGIFFCALLSLQISIWLPSPSNLVAKNRESDLRILIANVNTQNKDYDSVIDLVRTEKPDLAVFMEVDRLWQAELATLKDLLPYSSIKTHPDSFGLLIYSNLPLTNTQIKFLNRDRNSSVVTQIAIAGQLITLLATHPLPPAKPGFF